MKVVNKSLLCRSSSCVFSLLCSNCAPKALHCTLLSARGAAPQEHSALLPQHVGQALPPSGRQSLSPGECVCPQTFCKSVPSDVSLLIAASDILNYQYVWRPGLHSLSQAVLLCFWARLDAAAFSHVVNPTCFSVKYPRVLFESYRIWWKDFLRHF